MLRRGSPPRTEAAGAVRVSEPASSRWTPAHVEAARSGDFGYVHESFRTDRGTGSYLRVWERGVDGAWRGVLDVTAPPCLPRGGTDLAQVWITN